MRRGQEIKELIVGTIAATPPIPTRKELRVKMERQELTSTDIATNGTVTNGFGKVITSIRLNALKVASNISEIMMVV